MSSNTAMGQVDFFLFKSAISLICVVDWEASWRLRMPTCNLHACCFFSAATHYNTLQHTATHCYKLQLTAARCNTLQHSDSLVYCLITHYSALLRTATYCNTLQHTATQRFARLLPYNTLQHTATNCNALQHTTTHCNTVIRSFTVSHAQALQQFRVLQETLDQ